MRKIYSIMLIIVLLFSSTMFVYAEESTEETEYIVEEVQDGEIEIESTKDLPCPYTLYIMNAITHILDKEDGKLYMGVEFYCTYDMARLTTIFYLQQHTSSGWVDVAKGTIYAEDTDYMVKWVSVSNPPSGVYRTKTSNMAEDYYGYAECTTGYSPSLTYVSPYL